MLKARQITFITLLTIATGAALAQDAEKKAEAPAAASAAPAAPVIVGNPPADHPFGQLKIGMTYDEAIAIVGKPSSESSWCTGKQHIPFYFGNDKGRAQAIFKGMGKLDFYGADGGFWGKCGMQKILGLVYIEYDPKATGELPK